VHAWAGDTDGAAGGAGTATGAPTNASAMVAAVGTSRLCKATRAHPAPGAVADGGGAGEARDKARVGRRAGRAATREVAPALLDRRGRAGVTVESKDRDFRSSAVDGTKYTAVFDPFQIVTTYL